MPISWIGVSYATVKEFLTLRVCNVAVYIKTESGLEVKKLAATIEI